MKKIVVVGATSAMAQAASRLFAADGASFFLVGRDGEKLAHLAQDLQVRGAQQVGWQAMEITNIDAHVKLIEAADLALGGFDTVLVACGVLPNQNDCQSDISALQTTFAINSTSIIALLTLIANVFEKQRKGCIAVLSSPAGDRGRMSNYVYGAQKAALSVFCQGLRQRLHRSGVSVITIKPGFIDTPMTVQFKKGLLWSSSETAGRGIYRAITKEKLVAYVPGFWWAIMLIIKFVPERIFIRLSL